MKNAEECCKEALKGLVDYGDVMKCPSSMSEDMRTALGYKYFLQASCDFTKYSIDTHTVKDRYISGYSGSIDSRGNVSISPNYSSTKYTVGDSNPTTKLESADGTSEYFKVVRKGTKQEVLRLEAEICKHEALFLDARDSRKKIVSHARLIITWLAFSVLRIGYVIAGLLFLITAPAILHGDFITSACLVDTYLSDRLFGEITSGVYFPHIMLGLMMLAGILIFITGRQVESFCMGTSTKKKRVLQYKLPLIIAAAELVGFLLCIASNYSSFSGVYTVLFVNVARLVLLMACVGYTICAVKDLAERRSMRDMRNRIYYRNHTFEKDSKTLQTIHEFTVKELPRKVMGAEVAWDR